MTSRAVGAPPTAPARQTFDGYVYVRWLCARAFLRRSIVVTNVVPVVPEGTTQMNFVSHAGASESLHSTLRTDGLSTGT